jgi:hypothetical protein
MLSHRFTIKNLLWSDLIVHADCLRWTIAHERHQSLLLITCCCYLLQVSYVLDTEDVMYRQHSSRRKQQQQSGAPDGRVPKWQKWLETRCAAMGAAAEAAQAAAAEAPAAAEEAPAAAPAPAVEAA